MSARLPAGPLALLLAATAFGGCHGRYKRNADSLGAVQVRVVTPVQPGVDVGGGEVSAGEGTAVQDAVELGVDIAVVVLASRVEQKLQKAVKPELTEGALAGALAEDLEKADLPYAVKDKAKARMEVEVVDFGLSAVNGAPSVYVVTRTRIWDRDGRKVYSSGETCELPVGEALNLPFTDADELAALKRLEDLSPAQMRRLVQKTAGLCAARVARSLEKDAR
jgi:hypothetical protein